jgi:hypothetical protein
MKFLIMQYATYLIVLIIPYVAEEVYMLQSFSFTQFSTPHPSSSQYSPQHPVFKQSAYVLPVITLLFVLNTTYGASTDVDSHAITKKKLLDFAFKFRTHTFSSVILPA